MRHDFALDQILGRNPREVSRLFKSHGIDPERPYRAQITQNNIIIEQDAINTDLHRHAV
ncbi:hypothetical protein [Geoalkalibacter halelectricus]|uniref:Uncharacterized protein n=1 Tax=Geoalkalibacter halelectricus TaxID=2847045 RepID=A0ABY5ZPE6_9BACT|nr:hypothetical protein [Geoalkalibacter halelectricus]MDO3380097.1 hypothetical protein [Geoalkalibacter halelectricus]UWZ80384.1 hypothetical protein L9S41_03015 [Geoalkalibacter halelectricus]